MRRALALLVAVGLVAGAVALRQRLDDGGDTRSPDRDETFRLTCATTLAGVCAALAEDDDALRVTIEDPGVTADRLAALDASADPGFDGWFVDGPWDRITEDNRAFAGRSGQVLGDASAVLARSPAVLVSSEAGRTALPDDCDTPLGWACLGRADPQVRIGVPHPDRGDGLAVLAGATAAFLGTTGFATNDFDEPGFTGWFDRVSSLSVRTALGRQSPLEAALTRQGSFNVVGALESQAVRLTRGRDGWATTYPLPVVTADVALVAPAGGRGQDLLDRWGEEAVRAALRREGWRVDGSVPDGGVAEVELPEGSELPAPGVLQRLRELW